MESLLILIICFALGYFVGAVKTTLMFKNVLEEAAREVGVDITDQKNLKKKDIPVLQTETHGDILYLFERESDTFMCQGATLQELIKKLAENKGINIALVVHEAKPVWFVNGEIVEGPYEG